MTDITKIRLRIEQSTVMAQDYKSGRVTTRLLVDGREAYEDVRLFSDEWGGNSTKCQAVDETTELLAAALGRLMRAEREQADGE